MLADEHEQGVDGCITKILFVVDRMFSLLGNSEIRTRLGDVSERRQGSGTRTLIKTKLKPTLHPSPWKRGYYDACGVKSSS